MNDLFQTIIDKYQKNITRDANRTQKIMRHALI